jgi:hypothetical protein
MRIWGWIPTIGAELPKFSRRYFFSGSLLALCIISAYTWAAFPYDNLCLPDNPTEVEGPRTFTGIQLVLVDPPPEPFDQVVENRNE